MSKKTFTKEEIDKLSKMSMRKMFQKNELYTRMNLKEYLLVKMRKGKHQE